MLFRSLVATTALMAGAVSAQMGSTPVEPNVTTIDYTDDYDNGFALRGYVSLPKTTPAPAVVIIPDWDNVDEYEQVRATMIAQEFGWVGFAADVYGADYVDAGDENTTERRAQATMYRSNTTLFYNRIQAAVDFVKAHPAVNADQVAVIGYCFGGTGVIMYSLLGADVAGAVSFHGGLTNFTVETMTNPLLVLSGGDDDTGSEVEDLEARLNEANGTWQITRYSQIQHAFTKWTDDRYNPRADERSWHEMATFLGEAFGGIDYAESVAPATTAVDTVDYDDNGFALTGYLAIPDGAEMGKTPAVVVVPDWDGVSGPDGYEAQRATLLAQEGYVGFAADIYGSDLQQVESFDERGELTTLYRTNYTLFVQRIQAAVDLVAAHELVDPEQVLLIGYCFGGTGVVDYAFADLQNVKAVVPYHGGLTSLAPVQTDVVYPYVLVQSGGIDDAHGNNTELEMTLNMANATWEISRYSNVDHGFTKWDSDAYNALADWRSWDAMLSVFDMILGKTGGMDMGMDMSNMTTEEETSAVDIQKLAQSVQESMFDMP